MKLLIRKIFQFCVSNEKYIDFINQFLHEDVIIPGIATLKQFEDKKPVNVNKHFETEETAIEFLHPSLLYFTIQCVLQFRIKSVLQSQTYLPTLMGLALGMFLKFWVKDGTAIPMQLLTACQNIVFFTQEYLDTYLATGVV